MFVYTFSLIAEGRADSIVPRCPVTIELPAIESALCSMCTKVCPLPWLMPNPKQTARIAARLNHQKELSL